jgi:hypothetical protein
MSKGVITFVRVGSRFEKITFVLYSKFCIILLWSRNSTRAVRYEDAAKKIESC